MEKKSFLNCGTRAGQDIPEQSLRDVFNDLSKYIRNISTSLNAVLPKLPDNPDVTLNLSETFNSLTVLASSLSLHRHPSICILFTSPSRFISYNKPQNTPITSRSHTHPSHSQTSGLLTSSLSFRCSSPPLNPLSLQCVRTCGPLIFSF